MNSLFVVQKRSATYEAALLEKSRAIRQTESENMKTGRKKQRGMASRYFVRNSF